MEPKSNILKKISSKYILQLILSYLHYRTQLKIFQYSKKFQAKLGINIFTYQKFYIFKDIYRKLQKREDKIEFYYNYHYKKKSLLYLFESKELKDKKVQKEILNNFFLDIYQEYSKNIYVIIEDSIKYEYFLNLISINTPIKIKLHIELKFFCFSYSEDDINQQEKKPQRKF